MARAAHDTGNGAMLYGGDTSVTEISWDVQQAIEHSLMIINWQRNLPRKEVPPMWMWPFYDELDTWFEDVEANREAERGSSSSKSEDYRELERNELADQGIRQQF